MFGEWSRHSLVLLFEIVRQEGFELLKGARPPHAHAFVTVVESLLFLFRRVERGPSNGDRRLAFMLGKRGGGECLQRPGGAHRVPCYATLCIGKRNDVDDLFRL